MVPIGLGLSAIPFILSILRLAGAAGGLQNAKAVATGDMRWPWEAPSARLHSPVGGPARR
jgi:hypothetical protein